jgi:hypothetical protein
VDHIKLLVSTTLCSRRRSYGPRYHSLLRFLRMEYLGYPQHLPICTRVGSMDCDRLADAVDNLLLRSKEETDLCHC